MALLGAIMLVGIICAALIMCEVDELEKNDE